MLVSLIFEGPSVFVVAGKITTIMPGTFPIFLLSTKKIIVATTTTKASIKIIWKLPQTRSVILLVWYYWCLLKEENRNFCWNLKVTFPMSSTVQYSPHCLLTWMLRLQLHADVDRLLFSHWYFFLSNIPFFSPWTWRPLKMSLLFVITFRKIHMLFDSSRLSPQKILDTVSSRAYCPQIVVLYSQCLCKFSSSSLADVSSIFFFFNHLATQSCLMSFLAYIISVFFSFPE